MHLIDMAGFARRALTGYPGRTLLMLLAMAIGIGSVVLLSALGEGARRYVVNEFASLGTNLLIVLPGRSETVGGPPPMLAVTPRDLTLADTEALLRSRHIRYAAPIVAGAVPVSIGGREREVTILGSTDHLQHVRQLTVAQGRFLPPGELENGVQVAVLGQGLKEELFGKGQAVGERLRLGDSNFRVIGVLAGKGESIGLDMADVAVIPVAAAQALFDNPGLFRIMVEASSRESMAAAKQAITAIIRERHDGEDDITVISQDAVLATFDKIFLALTLTVAGIAAISLVVAGILIMNVMLVAVSQRRFEVGLLKALGAPRRLIVTLFLVESTLLSLAGALAGLLLAALALWAIGQFFPQFPLVVPAWALIAALSVSTITGITFGVLPARRAAALDPVMALSRR